MGSRDRRGSGGGGALGQLRRWTGQHGHRAERSAFAVSDREPVLKRPHDESSRPAHAYANAAAIANGRTLRGASAHARADARANRRANAEADAAGAHVAARSDTEAVASRPVDPRPFAAGAVDPRADGGASTP